jgi:hypothetical protein
MIDDGNAIDNETNSSSSSSSSTGSSEEPLRCVPLNVDGGYCAGYVDYLVPSDVDQSIAVLFVQANEYVVIPSTYVPRPIVTGWLGSLINNRNWQVTNDCPYYGNLQYQCYKWFPLCVNNT